MSLDLLKERFGVTKSTDKKEKDKQKLNEMFVSKPVGDIKSFKAQYQDELVEKDRIIENLKQELESQWLTNQTAFNTKKLYEDKIKKMDIVDSTNLIPTLVEVSKQKQGNVKLDWISWLEIPESNYLFQINESLAKKIFQENNLLIDRLRYRKGRGGDAPAKNYALSFDGDRLGATDSYATTNFNPDTYQLWNGFTLSFWIRPDELMNQTSTILGCKAINNVGETGVARFHVGFDSNGNDIRLGVGTGDMDNISNTLEVGKWHHILVTYAGNQQASQEKKVRMWVDTGARLTTKNNVSWTEQDEATETYTHGIYFGGRNTEGTGYSFGFKCALDEVAIYNRSIDLDGTFANEVYNAGINYNHLNNGQSGLVGYWKFNEGSGTTITDHSGNGNHGEFGAISGNTTAFPTWEEIKGY
jgi:hypothetical protein